MYFFHFFIDCLSRNSFCHLCWRVCDFLLIVESIRLHWFCFIARATVAATSSATTRRAFLAGFASAVCCISCCLSYFVYGRTFSFDTLFCWCCKRFFMLRLSRLLSFGRTFTFLYTAFLVSVSITLVTIFVSITLIAITVAVVLAYLFACFSCWFSFCLSCIV